MAPEIYYTKFCVVQFVGLASAAESAAAAEAAAEVEAAAEAAEAAEAAAAAEAAEAAESAAAAEAGAAAAAEAAAEAEAEAGAGAAAAEYRNSLRGCCAVLAWWRNFFNHLSGGCCARRRFTRLYVDCRSSSIRFGTFSGCSS